MPRFLVIEKRSLKSAVVIEADTWDDARQGRGEIIDESETDAWAENFISCVQVDDDCDVAEVP